MRLCLIVVFQPGSYRCKNKLKVLDSSRYQYKANKLAKINPVIQTLVSTAKINPVIQTLVSTIKWIIACTEGQILT